MGQLKNHDIKVIRKTDPVKGSVRLYAFIAVGVWIAVILPIIFIANIVAYASGNAAVMLGSGLVSVLLVLGLVVAIIHLRKRHRSAVATRQQAVTQFGESPNDLTTPPATEHPPFIYGIGSKRQIEYPASGYLASQASYSVMNYTYQKGHDGERHGYTILHFQIDKPLPHIVLDAHANDSLTSSIPVYFNDGQRIVLEGDFNQHFDLYAPVGYSTEALDVISPDFMQELMASQTAYDIEINGTSVYLIAGYGSDYAQLVVAANRLSQHLAYKMTVWQSSVDSQGPAQLTSAKGQRTIKIGNKRLSTAYTTAIALAVYAFIRTVGVDLFRDSPVSPVYVLLGLITISIVAADLVQRYLNSKRH